MVESATILTESNICDCLFKLDVFKVKISLKQGKSSGLDENLS
jgi:hypothetical protein